jgi:hypothetical protein
VSSPLSGAACLTLATVISLPLSKHPGGGCATPTFSSQLVYLQFCEAVPLPHSLELRAPCPLCYVSFFFFFFTCFFIIQFVFFSFFPGWGSDCLGGYVDLAHGCLWEYHVTLSSTDDLLLPSQLSAGVWRCRSPPGFSV